MRCCNAAFCSSSSWMAIIMIPAIFPLLMVVSVPMVPIPSCPKAAKKSWAVGP